MFNRNSRIECSEARQLVEEGAQLVDVRSPQEYAQGALPGAVNLPLQTLHAGIHQLDNEKPIIVYCVSGMRSSLAAAELLTHGFQAVHDLGTWRQYVNCN